MSRVISFHYKLTDNAGAAIDASDPSEPMAFLEGSGHILPKLESVLGTLKAGDKKRVELTADDAYGQPEEERVVEIERERFPKGDITVGDQFQVGQHGMPAKVVAVTESHVTLDTNHPLAGVDLVFDVEVVEIRTATPEEERHGHVHGPGGHHH